MSKSHAIHNEKACEYLLKSKEYNDWVITTAFYSALHYVQESLFPLIEEEKKFEEFTSYYNLKNTGENSISKHALTKKLVKEKLPQISSYYRWLFDQCQTARYHNYKVDEIAATLALKQLKELKKGLFKNK